MYRVRFRVGRDFDDSRERWEKFNCETEADAWDEGKAIHGRSGPAAVVLVYAYLRTDGKPVEDVEKDLKLLGAVEKSTD